MLTINEIFYSIQGESTRAGRPCVFVRLTACDLRCSWCDTPYAFHEGHKQSVDEVRRRLSNGTVARWWRSPAASRCCRRTSMTLMDRLLARGRTVMLETGGHRPIDRVPAAVVKIVDIKCPGSGEADSNDWANLDRLSPHDEVKFVVADRADYEFARDVIERRDLASRCAAVLDLAGTRRARRQGAVGVAARRSTARAPPAPAAQVHLAASMRGV